MKNIESLTIFEQEQPGMCGPAALRTLLGYLNIKKSEQELATLCGSSAERGTAPAMLEEGLKKLGLRVTTGDGNHKTIDERWSNLNHWINERNFPVLVDWFSCSGNPGGHYSTVLGLDKTYILLGDPEIRDPKKRLYKMKWEQFCNVWFDFHGDYPLSKEEFIVGWWLVAE